MVNCKNKLIITISFGFTTILWKNWVILSHFKHTLLLTPYDPLFDPSWGPQFRDTARFYCIKSCVLVQIWIWEAFVLIKVTWKKSFYLCMYFAHNQPYWIHFLSDFQNRDYFWNQQACPILVRSLVFFSTIQGVNHTWFSIFGENLGLSQKFT